MHEYNAHLVKTAAGWHIELVADDGTAYRAEGYVFDTMEDAERALKEWVEQNGGESRTKQ